jgi:hypothetical protein
MALAVLLYRQWPRQARQRVADHQVCSADMRARIAYRQPNHSSDILLQMIVCQRTDSYLHGILGTNVFSKVMVREGAGRANGGVSG